MELHRLLFIILLLPVSSVMAGNVEVVQTEFTRHGATWSVSATLRHGDTGWDHYADAWRVVDRTGKELAKRVLHHPHENEQPFTRSQTGISIPANVSVVYVEAHDKKHGWSKDRVRVDLNQPSGKNFRVNR